MSTIQVKKVYSPTTLAKPLSHVWEYLIVYIVVTKLIILNDRELWNHKMIGFFVVECIRNFNFNQWIIFLVQIEYPLTGDTIHL